MAASRRSLESGNPEIHPGFRVKPVMTNDEGLQKGSPAAVS